MDRWRVIGFRKVDFTDQQGKKISGYSLFLTRPGEGEDMLGDECMKAFISAGKVDYVPALGDHIELIYNRYGKIGNIALV